jgi:thioredoxin reductase (NADPH)
LFLLIGAEPHTMWLAGALERDDRGFLLTGRDLLRGEDAPQGWPLRRPPMLLETSLPGVFAAGDVRHRSIKRVAAAGEGATAIQLIHEYLAGTSPPDHGGTVEDGQGHVVAAPGCAAQVALGDGGGA